MQLTTLVLATASLTSTISALGINCQGSSSCSFGSGDVSRKLVGYITASKDVNRWYNNKQQIACVREPNGEFEDAAICAFLQYTGGAPLKNIQGLAHQIPDHGCSKCGSVPYFYPSSNDVTQGELTFNYVEFGCGKSGLCDVGKKAKRGFAGRRATEDVVEAVETEVDGQVEMDVEEWATL